MKLHLSSLVCGVALLTCVACAAPAASTPSDAPAATSLVSPLDSPLAVGTDIPIPQVTQDPTLGRVTGKILLKTGADSEPVPGRILYLAEIVRDASGNETAAGMDRTNSPRTFSDKDGSFMFPNVKPGRYSLVMDMINTAYLLKNPADDSDLIIAVTGAETQDFGTLTYDQLPK